MEQHPCGNTPRPTQEGGSLSTQSLARAFFLLALSVALSILVTAIQVSEAHAQDKSAELAEFDATCFSEQGEFEPTDGCYEYAESIGIEIDNLNKSADLGCTLEDMFEDYSCKGPSAPSSSNASEQAKSADTGCVTVDMTDPEVSGQDIDILTQQFGFDAKADNDDKLYSPECFEQGIVPFDFESMRNNPCYDVLGNSKGDVWVEYIGCPAPLVSEQAYTPLTQEGTPAPADWRSHVTRSSQLLSISRQRPLANRAARPGPQFPLRLRPWPTPSTAMATLVFQLGRLSPRVSEQRCTPRLPRWGASSLPKRRRRRPRARRSKG